VAEASSFKLGTQLGFAEAHHKITPIGKSGHGPGLGELPKMLWFHFNICTTVEARDFRYGTQLGFVKAHHKTVLRGKVGMILGYGSSQGSVAVYLSFGRKNDNDFIANFLLNRTVKDFF